MKEKTITLRAPRSIWVIMLVTSAIILTLTVISFNVEIEWWYRLAFLALSGLCPIALVELRLERVSLDAEGLTMVKGFRRQTIAREKVESVTWGKGVGVSITLVDGSWLKLPAVGKGNQAVSNTIRAWIKRTAKLRD